MREQLVEFWAGPRDGDLRVYADPGPTIEIAISVPVYADVSEPIFYVGIYEWAGQRPYGSGMAWVYRWRGLRRHDFHV